MPTQTGSLDLSGQKEAHDEAAKVATNYISVDSTGLMVSDGDGSQTPSTATERNVFIDSDSVEIRDGQDSRASFGEIVRLGKEYVSGATDNEGRAELDYRSLRLFDKEGEQYFAVEDLRDTTGIAEIEEKFYGTGAQTFWILALRATNASYSVEFSDGGTYSVFRTVLDFQVNPAPSSDVVITVTYETESPDAKRYLLGKPGEGSTGAFSVAEGVGTVAGGQYSHAEGYLAKALRNACHAEGRETEARGLYSHAEGNKTVAFGVGSHAEGQQTTASGTASHAEGGGDGVARGNHSHVEGYASRASGDMSHAEGHGCSVGGEAAHAEGNYSMAGGKYSHAQNERSNARKQAQTAIGTFNQADFSTSTVHPSGNTDYGKYALIVGNGVDENSRSNALAVDWNGNVEAAGEVKVGGSTPLVPIGTILDFAAAIPPTGYLVCDGSAVSRTDYAALFDVIGTTWGTGDGSTTFNLPDFRGRAAIGTGTGTASGATAHALGSTGGEETHLLTAGESGVHSHGHGMTQPAFRIGNHSHTLPNSVVGYLASSTQRMATSGSGTVISLNTNIGLNTGNVNATTMPACTRTTDAAVTNHAGSNATAAHNNMQPFATVTKIIRAL